MCHGGSSIPSKTIDGMLRGDLDVPHKPQRTARRVLARLVDERRAEQVS